MLSKIKRLLVVGVAALALAFAVPMMADAGKYPQGPPGYYQHDNGRIKYFGSGQNTNPKNQWDLVQPYEPGWCQPDCDDVIALAENGIALGTVTDFHVETIVVGDNVPDSLVGAEITNGGYAFGKNLELTASAFATGEDKKIWFWTIPGFAFADVDLKLTAKVFSLVFTNGVQYEGGLSYAAIQTIGVLSVDGSALATGTTGCPQFAEVGLEGKFGVGTIGNALSLGANGAYAQTWGEGETIVKVSAYDSDFATSTWFILPGVAYADIDGKVIVNQGLLVLAYVSPDGTTTFNFGAVSGGNAIALGDINIDGIKSSGMVSQAAMASDGVGAAAYGNSMASYKGAVGSTSGGRCLDTANGAGLAIVTGHNSVVNTGNSVVVRSHQTAFATTK